MAGIGAVVLSSFAVIIGASLGLAGDRCRNLVAPIRAFGAVSVVGLVLLSLLPEAIGQLGAIALILALVGGLVPAALDRTRRLAGGQNRSLGIELSFTALLAHQLCDGVALASESAIFHAHNHWDSLFAMSVHTIPVTTLTVISFSALRGTRSALFRALLIALATGTGVYICGLAPASSVNTWQPWLSAAVSGMLLHIVLSVPEARSNTGQARILDAIATLIGFAFVANGVIGSSHHSPNGQLLSQRLIEAFGSMALLSAPALLLGLGAGAAIAAFGAPIPSRWLASARGWVDSTRGALIGAPLPVCSCGVLPVSQGLRVRGASTAFLLAFLVATPEIGLDAFALSTRFLGWEFSILRVAFALLLAYFAGWAGSRIARRFADQASIPPASCCSRADPTDQHHGAPTPSFAQRYLSELDDLLLHIGPWAILGLVVAAYAEALLPSQGLVAELPAGVDVLLLTALAIPSYVCASSMTPLAAVLIGKGFSAGSVIAALLLGPATNVATFAFVRGELGTRGCALWLGLIITLSWGLAWVTNVMVGAGVVSLPTVDNLMEHTHEPSWWMMVTAVGLIALIARGVWKVGFIGWVSALGNFMVRPSTLKPEVTAHQAT